MSRIDGVMNFSAACIFADSGESRIPQSAYPTVALCDRLAMADSVIRQPSLEDALRPTNWADLTRDNCRPRRTTKPSSSKSNCGYWPPCQPQPRDGGSLALWRPTQVAVRHRVGQRGHGTASQTLPHARRQLQSAPCRGARGGSPARSCIQCRSCTCGHEPHSAGARPRRWHARCGGTIRSGQGQRSAHLVACDRHAGCGSGSRCRHRSEQPILEPKTDRERRANRRPPAASGCIRRREATVAARPSRSHALANANSRPTDAFVQLGCIATRWWPPANDSFFAAPVPVASSTVKFQGGPVVRQEIGHGPKWVGGRLSWTTTCFVSPA